MVADKMEIKMRFANEKVGKLIKETVVRARVFEAKYPKSDLRKFVMGRILGNGGTEEMVHEVMFIVSC